MITQNIGFYEAISKIISELSSNIIKYAHYLLLWVPTMIFLISALNHDAVVACIYTTYVLTFVVVVYGFYVLPTAKVIWRRVCLNRNKKLQVCNDQELEQSRPQNQNGK